MEFKYEIDGKTLTEYENNAKGEIFPRFKTVEEIAQDMARKATLRWEELQLEKATTAQLIHAKLAIEEELKRRT